MAQPRPTRLREIETAPPLEEAKVIDARYKVVGRKRRALKMVWGALVAAFWAAVIGFLIPPTWVFLESVGRYFAQD